MADDPELFHAPFPANITPGFSHLCQTREIIFLNPDDFDRMGWPGTFEWHRSQCHREAAALALMAGNQPLGELGLAWLVKTQLMPEELELIHALANQAALAIQLTRLAEATKQAAIAREQEKAARVRAAELERANVAIGKTLQRLAGVPDLDDFLCQILVEVRAQLGASMGHLFCYDPTAHTLSLEILIEGERALTRARASDVEPFGQPIPAGITPFWATLIARQQPLWLDVDDPECIPLYRPDDREWHRRLGNPVALCVPLLLGQQALGFLGLTFKTRNAVLPEKARLAQVFAHQATLAIQLTRLAEEAKQTAIAKEQEKAALERAAELTELNVALSVSESRLRTLFEQLPVSLQIFSDGGLCLEVNRAWSELWQLPRSTVIGKNTLVTPLNPSSQLPSPFTPYLQRCFAGEPVVVPPLLFDPAATFQSGRARWVQTYIYPIKDQADGLREVLLIHQDIHALKQAEEVARGQTEALIQVLRALVTEPNLDQLLAQVIITSTAQLNAPASTLWLCDAQMGDNLLHLTCCGSEVSSKLPVGMEQDSVSGSIPEQAWQQMERTRSPVVLSDIATHPAVAHLRPWLMQQQVRALMLVPLLLGNQMIGGVGIHNTTRNYFRPEEIQLAQALAHQITLAIQLTQLASQTRLSAILEERNRLAGEIHDTLAQTFTGISIQVGVAKRIVSLDPQEAQRILERVSELAQMGLTEARRSVWALYSPTAEDADLAQLLLHSVEQMTSDTSIQVSVSVEGTSCSLSTYVSQNLLRMGQEALTNILKHAQAGAIWIKLIYASEYVSLSVRDNGRGFVLPTATNSSGAGFGLIGMYQRAERIGGQLTITTQPGQGTEIVVRVPVS